MPRGRALVGQGRRRWTTAEARAALSALEGSGLSVAAFAVRQGVRPERLYRWRRQLATGRFTAERASPAFVELRPGAGEHIEVVLRSGRVLRAREAIEPLVLQRLVLVLEKSEPC